MVRGPRTPLPSVSLPGPSDALNSAACTPAWPSGSAPGSAAGRVCDRLATAVGEDPGGFTEGAIDSLIAAAAADPDGFLLLFRHVRREPETRASRGISSPWGHPSSVLRARTPTPIHRAAAGRPWRAWRLYTALTAVVGLGLTIWTALAFQRDAANLGLIQRARRWKALAHQRKSFASAFGRCLVRRLSLPGGDGDGSQAARGTAPLNRRD
jgi:hypothetical protein